MKIAIVGSGYVGLVAGACFADSGNRVLCVDNDEDKVRRLEQGDVPIFEPGLKEIVERNTKAGRLSFSSDLAEAVRLSRIVFLAVGTPPAADGSPDLSAILSVAADVGRAMDGYRIVVMKSTVPVGTHKEVSTAIAAETDHPFDYVSNPEFLKEGAAIEDFTRPDRVVIGATNPAVVEIMRELYGSFLRRDERIYVMDPASAEMTKYAANAMLATRISFMNEVANLCDKFGADVEAVRRGVGSDSRIGTAFLFPGVGYGGSCFPKDVNAFVSMGRNVGVPAKIAAAVEEVNRQQRRVFADKVIHYFGAKCRDTTLAVWGLAFKSWTDDVRESPAVSAIRMFRDQGMAVRAHDPEAMKTGARELGDAVVMADDQYEMLENADALVVFTDWPKFRTPDFDLIGDKLKSKLVFDGRNLYDPRAMSRKGFTYYCMGRPPVAPA